MIIMRGNLNGTYVSGQMTKTVEARISTGTNEQTLKVMWKKTESVGTIEEFQSGAIPGYRIKITLIRHNSTYPNELEREFKFLGSFQ